MRVFLSALVLVQALFAAQVVQALDEAEQRWARDLVNTDVSYVRRAAQEMYNARNYNQRLLDIMAEVILESYDIPPTGFTHADALAWCMNVIGASHNWRYNDVLKEVEANGYHKKVRKFAKKNRKELLESGAAQYKKGGVSLDALRR